MRGASLRGTGIVLIAIRNRYRDLNIVIYGDDTRARADDQRRLSTLSRVARNGERNISYRRELSCLY